MSGIFKTMTSEGRDNTTHHNPVEAGHMKQLADTGVIGTENPKALQNLVWLSIALHFAKRGSQGWRGMTKNTLVQGVDDQGMQFLEYGSCEKQKNHPGDVDNESYRPEARMYARPGNPLCPVSAYLKYVSHLKPELDALWQRPNPNWQLPGGSWYCKSPLGVQTLGKMMKKMSFDAGLSTIYTNHCLRATASVGLAHAGHERSDICIVTGHKNVRSLDPYINKPSDAKKRKLSDNIGNIISVDREPLDRPIVDLNDDCEVDLVLSQGCEEYLEDSALSQVASEAEEDDIISQVALEVEDTTSPLPGNSAQQVLSSLGRSIFSNCNIKNVNIKIVKK